MDLYLKNKKVVLTGGTRGIGLAIAKTLAAEGCSLAICARTKAELDTVVSDLSRQTVAIGQVVDLGKADDITKWTDAIQSKFGDIDGLVLNASALADQNSNEHWHRALDIDILSGQTLINTLGPALVKSAQKNGDASIVAISSVSAAVATRAEAYGAIKAALNHYIKGVARDFAPKSVRANTVSPGTTFFEDGFWGRVKQNMPDVYQEWVNKNPMGRMARTDEIANVVTFLLSSRASFVTGSNIMVDGALTDRVNF